MLPGYVRNKPPLGDQFRRFVGGTYVFEGLPAMSKSRGRVMHKCILINSFVTAICKFAIGLCQLVKPQHTPMQTSWLKLVKIAKMPCSSLTLATRAFVTLLLSLAAAHNIVTHTSRDSEHKDFLKAYRRVLLKAHPSISTSMSTSSICIS